tara:strand:+ start:55 stop:405 length:351 start_codon:yes stop_codon:yes gene_type:complete
MAVDKVKLCPWLGEACIEDGSIREGKLVSCNFWVTIAGRDPQTNKEINSGDCAINWIPMLLIENSKVSRETGAAVESFRNEMVKSNKTTQHILLEKTKETNISNLIEVKNETNDNS